MDFLDRLRDLSKKKGIMNNMQLSKASGVPYTTIDGFYRVGYDNAKLSTLKKLAKTLDCTLEYLVNGDVEEVGLAYRQTLDRIAKRYTDSPVFRQLLDVYASLDRAEQDAVEHYIMLLAEAVARGQDPALVDPTADDLEANAAALSQQAAGHDDAAADG